MLGLGILGKAVDWATGNDSAQSSPYEASSSNYAQQYLEPDMGSKKNGKGKGENQQSHRAPSPPHRSFKGSLLGTHSSSSLQTRDTASSSAERDSTTPRPSMSYASVAGGSSGSHALPLLSSKINKSATEQHNLALEYEDEQRRDKAMIVELEKKLSATGLGAVQSRHKETQVARAEKGIAALRQERDHHSSTADRLGAELASAKQGEVDIERAFHELEKKHGEVEKMLGEARSFLSLDDCGDLNLVITKLGDINEAVDDIAFRFAQEVPETVRLGTIPVALGVLTYQRAAIGYATAFALLQSAQVAGPAQLEQVVYPIFKGVLSETLAACILQLFHPGATRNGAHDVLGAILQQLRQQGNRAQAAQWRAMSYSAVQAICGGDQGGLRADLSGELVHALGIVFSTLDTPSPEQDTFVQPILLQIQRLVDDSLAWQRLIRQRYLSTDFDLIFHTQLVNNDLSAARLPFDGERMLDARASEQGGNAEVGPKQVVAPLSIGVEQLQIKKEGDGTVAVERKVLVKAEVWTERVGGAVAEWQALTEQEIAAFVSLPPSEETTPGGSEDL